MERASYRPIDMRKILLMKFSWVSVIPMLAATTIATVSNLKYRDEILEVSQGFPFRWHRIIRPIIALEPSEKYQHQSLLALGMNILIAFFLVVIIGVLVQRLTSRFLPSR
jgi:hypothetical protein